MTFQLSFKRAKLGLRNIPPFMRGILDIEAVCESLGLPFTRLLKGDHKKARQKVYNQAGRKEMVKSNYPKIPITKHNLIMSVLFTEAFTQQLEKQEKFIASEQERTRVMDFDAPLLRGHLQVKSEFPTTIITNFWRQRVANSHVSFCTI
jgi:hypothetical protein